MNFKDLIEILIEYNIIQTERIDEKRTEGLFDPENKTIFLNNNKLMRDKRDTIIHELLHAHYYNKCEKKTEAEIIAEAAEIVKKIYNTKGYMD